tara:strand:+ start:3645 stop:4118 length:474 start_codon:yes stop_codon:yes gene_type:complete
MKSDYLNIYNNLIKLTRNKLLFQELNSEDTFSDRITIFFFHFAFFLKVYKTNNPKSIMQEIYDFNFKQIELSIREIGYGDQSINKKMKNYINVFYAIITKIDSWDELDNLQKNDFFTNFLNDNINSSFFVDYFNKYKEYLAKNTLNHFTKDIKVLKI